MAAIFGAIRSGASVIRNISRTSPSHGRLFSRSCTSEVPHHLCLNGNVNGSAARMLVATGSRRNAISAKLAALASCKGLTLQLGEHYRTSIDAVVKDSDSDGDVILGVEWLSTIGQFTINFQSDKPYMEFFHEGRKIRLTGV